ncbi:MAG: DUF695 domain-containing protein [Algibacter sp.]
MNLLKSFFRKEKSIQSNSDFWDWFIQNEKRFHQVVKSQGNISKVFFSKLGSKLDELRSGYWFLTGMSDEKTVELIITADGAIKNIVFVEELVSAAPKLEGWKFTALKPEAEMDRFGIKMDGYDFSNDQMCFYSNDLKEYPDEIDITITHNELNKDNQSSIINGVYIYLDNTLGELKSVATIDNLKVINGKDATKDLVPLEKLKDFLIWREKEFVEKYEGSRRDTESDNYAIMEAKSKSGNTLLATINTGLLVWDSKPSHPWVAVIEFECKGETNNGMPSETDYALLNTIEDEIMLELKDFDGYLNIGRQTEDGVREIYFTCIDFRKPSKVFDSIKLKYSKSFKIDFDIYKDKYWQSFNRFMSK